MKRKRLPDKRIEQPWVSTYGLLVALGMPMGALAPLRAEVLPVLDHECARSAGVDVPLTETGKDSPP